MHENHSGSEFYGTFINLAWRKYSCGIEVVSACMFGTNKTEE